MGPRVPCLSDSLQSSAAAETNPVCATIHTSGEDAQDRKLQIIELSFTTSFLHGEYHLLPLTSSPLFALLCMSSLILLPSLDGFQFLALDFIRFLYGLGNMSMS